MSSERVVIGQSGQAGLSISAPTSQNPNRYISPGSLRWVHYDTHFALEQMDYRGNWHEVPVVLPAQAPAPTCKTCGPPEKPVEYQPISPFSKR
jgi:hypothetical protein